MYIKEERIFRRDAKTQGRRIHTKAQRRREEEFTQSRKVATRRNSRNDAKTLRSGIHSEAQRRRGGGIHL